MKTVLLLLIPFLFFGCTLNKPPEQRQPQSSLSTSTIFSTTTISATTTTTTTVFVTPTTSQPNLLVNIPSKLLTQPASVQQAKPTITPSPASQLLPVQTIYQDPTPSSQSQPQPSPQIELPDTLDNISDQPTISSTLPISTSTNSTPAVVVPPTPIFTPTPVATVPTPIITTPTPVATTTPATTSTTVAIVPTTAPSVPTIPARTTTPTTILPDPISDTTHDPLAIPLSYYTRCIDTDMANSSTVFGTVTIQAKEAGPGEYKTYDSWSDTCLRTYTVQEIFCASGRDYGTKSLTCPTGTVCSGGRCAIFTGTLPARPLAPTTSSATRIISTTTTASSTTTSTATSTAATSTAATSTALTCTDSDGGKIYNTKGTVRRGTYTGTDYCFTSSPRTLWEYFCRADNTVGSEMYTCPNTCSNGVCVVPATTTTTSTSNCTSNSNCGYKQICRSGKCVSVECTNDSQCSGCSRCSDNQCRSCGYGPYGCYCS